MFFSIFINPNSHPSKKTKLLPKSADDTMEPNNTKADAYLLQMSTTIGDLTLNDSDYFKIFGNIGKDITVKITFTQNTGNKIALTVGCEGLERTVEGQLSPIQQTYTVGDTGSMIYISIFPYTPFTPISYVLEVTITDSGPSTEDQELKNNIFYFVLYGVILVAITLGIVKVVKNKRENSFNSNKSSIGNSNEQTTVYSKRHSNGWDSNSEKEFCPKCGAENTGNAFCRKCGEKLK